MSILRTRLTQGVDVYTDGWKNYDALAVYGLNHKKVLHEKDEFSHGGGNYTNGIESFWSYTKRRLAKFNGIPKHLLGNYLKETDWRFNNRGIYREETAIPYQKRWHSQ